MEKGRRQWQEWTLLRDPVRLWHSVMLSVACWGGYLRHSKNLDLCRWLKVLSALQGCAYPLPDRNPEFDRGGTVNECSLWWRSPLKRTLNFEAPWWSWKGQRYQLETEALTIYKRHTHDFTLTILSKYLRAGEWRSRALGPRDHSASHFPTIAPWWYPSSRWWPASARSSLWSSGSGCLAHKSPCEMSKASWTEPAAETKAPGRPHPPGGRHWQVPRRAAWLGASVTSVRLSTGDILPLTHNRPKRSPPRVCPTWKLDMENTCNSRTEIKYNTK